MEYADSLWAHLGGDADTDVTTQSEVDAWLEKVLAEADDSNLDASGVDNEPLSETTWNAQARRAILRRTASGEPDWIEAARRIVNTGAYETVDGMAFDNFAASAVLQVYEAVNDENKAKLGALSLPQAVSITFKMINRNRAVARRTATRRTAGAPTIMGEGNGPPPGTPKEEQDAYWAFVSQGAADSDSGWYVPLSFSSWRSGYWDDTKGDTTYAPGMPPMAGARRQAASYGEQSACKTCGMDVEYHGVDVGWIGRGSDQYCDESGAAAPRDQHGELTDPLPHKKHQGSRRRAADEFKATPKDGPAGFGEEDYPDLGFGPDHVQTGDDDEEELYDDWVHDGEWVDEETGQVRSQPNPRRGPFFEGARGTR